MNVGEITLRVQRQFGDEASVQIAEADVIRWINDAQAEIALKNQLLQSIATTAVIINQQAYALPDDILTLRSVHYAGNKLQALSSTEAEEYIAQPNNTDSRGTPQRFWIWANQIFLYPRPDGSDPDDLKIFYTKQPTPVVNAADTPELPTQYHNRIVEYCLQQAYELDENWAAAQAKAEQFVGGINELKDNVDWVERDFYPSIVSVPEWD